MGDDRGGALRLSSGAPGPTGAPSGPDRVDLLDALHARTLECHGDVDAALALATDLGGMTPHPGSGRTAEAWERLATVAAADPTVARVAEPHLDALAILAEAGEHGEPDATWGVYAAEASGMRLEAVEAEGGWLLTGRKPWCSLAGRLSRALVTATTPEGRRLFRVGLRDRTVAVADTPWVARGLAAVPSGPVDFDGAPAVPVGAAGWYLERRGFAWGGIGVAAVWWGAAVGIARGLRESVGRRDPDQIALMHLGAVDVALWTARTALGAAAAEVDGGTVTRNEARVLAHRTRAAVATAAEEVIRRVGHALGPAPLALDDLHAGRVADLELYLRQHHAERDEAALGRALAGQGDVGW